MGRAALGMLLVAFAAGGAFGYLIGTARSGAGGTLPSLSSDAGDGRAAPAGRAGDTDPARLAAPPGGGPGRPGPGLDLPPVPTGDGTIEGTVHDEAGRPLAGVLVRATWFDRKYRGRWSRGAGAPEDKDLDTTLRESAERYRYNLSTRRDATTDDSGAFTLTRIAPGTYSVQAYLEGYELRPIGNSNEAKAGDRVEFTGKALAVVPVRVLLPDGTEPETARIDCSAGQNRGNWSMPWNRDQPQLRLDPGVCRLRAVGGDDDALRSDEAEVIVEEGGRSEPVTLALKDAPGIRGRVVFESPEENASGQVVALFLAPGEKPEPDVQRLRRANDQAWFHGSRSGPYTFFDLKPGTWYLAALIQGQEKVGASAVVEVGDRMVKQDLSVPAPDPGEYVIVAVEAPDGTPVADAQISAGYAAERRSRSNSRFARLPDGTYRVFHAVEMKDAEAGARFSVSVSSSKYGQKSVEYAPAPGARATCRFDEPGFVEITVTGLAGSGLEDAVTLSVAAVAEGDRGIREINSWSGQEGMKDGKATFGPLAPGRYEAVLGIREERWGNRTVSRVPFDLGPGKSTQSVPLPALYSLTVVTGDDAIRVSISSRDSESPAMRFGSNRNVENGRAVFERIPAGEYVVYVSGGESQGGRMNVNVPGSSVVEFRPIVVNAFLLHVTDPAGAMAKAGLREGDVVVAIDGMDCANERQMNALLALAREKPTSKLTVLRGGTTVELTVNAAEAARGRSSGGSWEATAR